MNALDAANRIREKLIFFREHIHRNPELSDVEEKTVAFVAEQLNAAGIIYDIVPGGGVMGYIEGAAPGKSIVLRADMDALPIPEDPKNGGGFPKACVSQVEGVSHACGHDVHTAVLLGSALLLNEIRDQFSGRVILYFERGEENGNGDYYMTQFIAERKLAIDGAWALHVNPEIPSGKIGLTPGSVYAGGIFWNVLLEKDDSALASPIACASSIARKLSSIPSTYFSPFEALTLSVCRIIGDENSCKLVGTCRLHDRERIGTSVQEKISTIIEKTASLYGYSKAKFKVSSPSACVVNDERCCQLAIEGTCSELGEASVVSFGKTMGCESFRVLSSRYPSVMASLGVSNGEKGITGEIHTPQFDIDNDALVFGVAATVRYALDFLNSSDCIRKEEV